MWPVFFKQFGTLDSVVGPRAKMRASKMMHIFYLSLFLMENEVKVRSFIATKSQKLNLFKIFVWSSIWTYTAN